ncbi:MAG: hypothetical protein RI580_19110, partial [Halothece sp. Uz-M2-17]|nr:hypothetical protein [Halothece sp. Uz-M2-17]
CFIQYNKNIEDFKQVITKLRPNFASGSWVPVLERYQKFLESLLSVIRSLMNPSESLPYRKYIEDLIQEIKNIIEQEKKRDFLGA